MILKRLDVHRVFDSRPGLLLTLDHSLNGTFSVERFLELVSQVGHTRRGRNSTKRVHVGICKKEKVFVEGMKVYELERLYGMFRKNKARFVVLRGRGCFPLSEERFRLEGFFQRDDA